MDCVFCRIVRGEIPSVKVYEDEEILSFLDIAPANKGHALVIPKKHYETFDRIPRIELRQFIERIQEISIAVIKATGSEGYNIVINNGKAAGQIVPHAHFHVIPRFATDAMMFSWEHKTYSADEIKLCQEKIISFLNKLP